MTLTLSLNCISSFGINLAGTTSGITLAGQQQQAMNKRKSITAFVRYCISSPSPAYCLCDCCFIIYRARDQRSNTTRQYPASQNIKEPLGPSRKLLRLLRWTGDEQERSSPKDNGQPPTVNNKTRRRNTD